MRRIFLVLAAIAVTNLQLFAHDMWIEPTTFSPEAGKVIGIKLRVGQDLLGDPVPRDSALINQFFVVDSTGRKPVVGREGWDPAGLVVVGAPGLFVLGYQSNASRVELSAQKFNQYLKEEGLEVIAAARARRNETGAGAREMFRAARRAWCCPDQQRKVRAIGSLVSRSNLWPNGIPMRTATCRFV